MAGLVNLFVDKLEVNRGEIDQIESQLQILGKYGWAVAFIKLP